MNFSPIVFPWFGIILFIAFLFLVDFLRVRGEEMSLREYLKVVELRIKKAETIIAFLSRGYLLFEVIVLVFIKATNGREIDSAIIFLCTCRPIVASITIWGIHYLTDNTLKETCYFNSFLIPSLMLLVLVFVKGIIHISLYGVVMQGGVQDQICLFATENAATIIVALYLLLCVAAHNKKNQKT